MAPNGSQWMEMTQNGLKWLQIVPKVLNHFNKKMPKVAQKWKIVFKKELKVREKTMGKKG